MTEEKKKTPTYDELDGVDRHLLLSWIRESIHQGMKKQIMHHAYRAFVHALHSDEPFDPHKVWDLIPGSSRQHFEHAADILAGIESDMEEIEDGLEEAAREGEELEPSQEQEPARVNPYE